MTRWDSTDRPASSGWTTGAGTRTPVRPARPEQSNAALRGGAAPATERPIRPALRDRPVTRGMVSEALPQTFAEKWTPWAMTILRIGVGLLFMQHGAQKLFGLLGGFGPDGGTAQLLSQMGLAGVLEFFGGAAIVLGLLTRPVAALLVVEMLWAYVQAHLPQGGFPIRNGGELAVMYALVFLVFAVRGAGRWSVDGTLARRSAA